MRTVTKWCAVCHIGPAGGSKTKYWFFRKSDSLLIENQSVTGCFFPKSYLRFFHRYMLPSLVQNSGSKYKKTHFKVNKKTRLTRLLVLRCRISLISKTIKKLHNKIVYLYLNILKKWYCSRSPQIEKKGNTEGHMKKFVKWRMCKDKKGIEVAPQNLDLTIYLL